MFDCKHWRDVFLTQPGQNDAPWVKIQRASGDQVWRCIGVHRLTGDENRGNHHVYLAVVDRQGARVPHARMGWTWVGRQETQMLDPVALDKPDNEPWGNIPLGAGQIASIWVYNGASDLVSNLTTSPELPDEPGATRFHQSTFVMFQQVQGGDIPPPPPPPGPTPEPFDVTPVLDMMTQAAHGHQEANNVLIDAIQRLRDLAAVHRG